MSDTISSVLIASLAGVGPAIFWLIFWLREDEHPEPRSLILLSFLLGMACVPIVVPFEYLASHLLIGSSDISNIVGNSLFTVVAVVFLWAAIEEVAKYIASHIGHSRIKAIDEPMDWIVYMISTALGFAAAENTLFLISPIIQSDIMKSFVTGNLRFIGATLLHIVASATIGVFMALAFYKSKKMKFIYKNIGLLAAITLHTCFNFFIIVSEQATLLMFALVWSSMIALILVFERIKKIKPPELLN